MPTRRELFVWYRVRRDRADDVREAVAAFHRELVARWPSLRARLLVRDDGELATWMETYARSDPSDPTSPGIDVEVEAAITAAAQPLAALIDGARHSEAFESVG